MLLVIDAGNTNTVFALYRGSTMVHSWRCQTAAGRTADEYAAWLYPLFERAGLSFSDVETAIIGSVVPDADYYLRQLCETTFKCQVHSVTSKDFESILTIDMDKPQDVGADRLVNAAGVVLDYQSPAIVVDFGTATTFDVIGAGGIYKGGIIAPGVHLSANALYQAAAKLPRIDIIRPERVIGKDTISAMQSGIFWGYQAMIAGLLETLTGEMGDTPFVLATGGLARLFADAVPAIDKVDDDLTLRGLWHIYHVHNPKKAA